MIRGNRFECFRRNNMQGTFMGYLPLENDDDGSLESDLIWYNEKYNKMRKVKFKKFIPATYIWDDGVEYTPPQPLPEGKGYAGRKQKPGTNQYTPDYIHDGVFHGFGHESTDGDNALVMDTYAIIELPDGTVEHVIPKNIKFIN